MRRIIIAGVGQIGSRYLQGLANLAEACEIWALDVSLDSLTVARQRWEEVPGSVNHVLKLTSNIEEIKGIFDLAIVACTADARPTLVATLSKQSMVRAWLLEKILAQSIDGLNVIKESISQDASAWVNTPMMNYPLYKQLVPRLKDAPVEAYFLNISGVACNSIHYIDYVSRLRNTVVDQVEVDQLKTWSPYVKRPSLFDVEGLIKVRYSDESILFVSGVASSRSSAVQFSIRSRMNPSEVWNVFEQEGKAVSSGGVEIRGQGVYLQSESTTLLVKKIFAGLDTGLPTLLDSLSQHRPLLASLLRHWNDVMPNKLDSLPIT